MSLELLVTGTGRSGTGTAAEVLTRAGMTCTHEGLFTPHGVNDLHDAPAESSWLAVPHLTEVSALVVLIVRDPLSVVRSLLGIKFFETEGPYLSYALEHEPALARLSPVNAAWAWWTVWNLRAMEHADAVIALGGTWALRLAEVADLPPMKMGLAARQVGKANHRDRAGADEAMKAEPKRITAAKDLYEAIRSTN